MRGLYASLRNLQSGRGPAPAKGLLNLDCRLAIGRNLIPSGLYPP